MEITINNIPKLTFNKYNHLHWTKKREFKDNLRLLLMSVSLQKFTGSYNLDFTFTFKGRQMDTINVVHYCKIIEDYFFKDDKDNRRICIEVNKGNENKCVLILTK